ncbi:MAG: UPF0149 family protein [Rhodospirillales bacterium]|nr:UPF0149 family protein [Rhodospirillales bacterium]
MTLDECRAALRSATTTPVAALEAAMGLAAELAPEMGDLLARAAAGEPLLLEEERLLRYGLTALAAARRTEIFPAFAALLAQPDLALAQMLDGSADVVVAPLVTALFDGNPAPLAALAADPETPADLREALFTALAWLVRDGRVTPAVLADLLDRFVQDDPPPVDDAAWFGWFAAARVLGREGQVEAMRQRLVAELPDWMDEADREDWQHDLNRACQPDTLDLAAPIEHPAAAFPPPVAPPAPAQPMDLTTEEMGWLDSRLMHACLDDGAMPLEAVDGYFTALHVTPAPADYAACRAAIWRDGTAQARLGRAAVAEAAEALLQRRFASIGARLAAGQPPEPFLEVEDEVVGGKLWAAGFMMGLDAQQAVWDRLLRRPAVRDLVAPLALLEEDTAADDDLDLEGDEADGAPDAERDADLDAPGNAEWDADADGADTAGPTPEERAELLDDLPETVLRLHELVRTIALRPESGVGRNDPCPCGSGRKFKKCCGAPGAVPKF